MRLYFYVSRALGANHLFDILISAKRSNIETGITGLISYNKGRYLQIVEGEDDDVARLIDSIKRDKRHHHVQTILDIQTKRRYFSNWSMKLLPLPTTNQHFQVFISEMEQGERLSSDKKMLIDTFHHSEELENGESSISPGDSFNWESQLFSVSNWPNFSRIKPSAEIISLCGRLLNNPMTYQDILADQHCSSEQELKRILKQLIQSGCLTIKPRSQDEMTGAATEHLNNHLSFSFVNKMREFIHARLH